MTGDGGAPPPERSGPPEQAAWARSPARAGWPADADALAQAQDALAQAQPGWWNPGPQPTVGASYCCFARGSLPPGGSGERGWAAAASKRHGARAVVVTATGPAGAPYVPGQLALREGPLREAALRRLDALPDVVLVDAAGRDHPRGAGLALHLGAVLDLPTVGVTDRPLVAAGEPPADERGARSPLWLDGAVVGYWVRTRPGVRPVAVHAGWQTSPETAAAIVTAAVRRARTPQPLREARRGARQARAEEGG